MRIGIDAKWFFDGPPSGKVVVANLVKNLIEVNSNHKLIFFIDKKKIQDFPYSNETIELCGVWSGNNLLSNLFCLPKAANANNIDILIYQNFPSITSAYKQISYIHDIIFITHPRFYSLRERIYFLPLKMLTRRADYICTVSHAEKQRIMQYYNIPDERIDFVHHGVDPIFKPLCGYTQKYLRSIKTKYGLPENYLLYVGRLNIRKNIFNLLEGFAQSKYRKNKLVIVGGYDWKMTDIQKFTTQLNLNRELIFTGPVFGKELAAIYAMAGCFCFPSYEESFGLPPLEAMASGVPVIVSNSSSIPEICEEAGTYVEANDPHDIANKINLLMSDEKLRKKKSAQGINQAAKFTWNNSAYKLLAMCEKLVKK